MIPCFETQEDTSGMGSQAFFFGEIGRDLPIGL